MTIQKTLRNAVDSWVIQSSPSNTRVYDHILRVNGDSGGSAQRQSFIFFPNLVLDSSIIVASAKLYLYAEGAMTGSPFTLTAKRVTTKWKAHLLTWTNKPTVTATHQVDVVEAANLADGDEVVFDVTSIMNDVAGSTFFGFQISVSTSGNKDFASANSQRWGKKPRLEITYYHTPDAPTDLRPSSGPVSTQTPWLAWSGSVNQLAFQVQVSTVATAGGFVAAIVHDSGVVTDERERYNLADTAYSLPSSGSRYWRVRQQNALGGWSPYSDIIFIGYLSPGVLTITNPAGAGAFVEETTPPIDWTFTGRTQKSYKVILQDQGSVIEGMVYEGWGDNWGNRYGDHGFQDIWDSGWQKSTATRVTIPPHLIRRLDNSFYRVIVRVRDDQNRDSSPGVPEYVEAQRIFSFQENGGVSAVSSLTVTNPEGWYVQLDWVDPTQPDYIGIKVDGEYVLDREDPSKFLTGGTNYRKKFYHSRPLRLSEYEVVRITKVGGIYKHSTHAANPHPTFRFIPLGMWLVDEQSSGADVAVNLGSGGDDVSVDLAIAEGVTVYHPLGRRDAVRIVDYVGGFEGSITGMIRGMQNKEFFESMKAELPHKIFRLVVGDLSIRCRLGVVGDLHPTSNPVKSSTVSDKLWRVTVEVFQADDWTFQARF